MEFSHPPRAQVGSRADPEPESSRAFGVPSRPAASDFDSAKSPHWMLSPPPVYRLILSNFRSKIPKDADPKKLKHFATVGAARLPRASFAEEGSGRTSPSVADSAAQRPFRSGLLRCDESGRLGLGFPDTSFLDPKVLECDFAEHRSPPLPPLHALARRRGHVSCSCGAASRLSRLSSLMRAGSQTGRVMTAALGLHLLGFDPHALRQ